jgi:hypothetical protein
MKKIIFLLSLLFVFSLPAFGYVPGTNCSAIFRVPSGQPYNSRIARPPFFEQNRWECLTSAVGATELENSPGDGVTTDYAVDLRYDTTNGVEFYRVDYADINLIKFYVNGQLANGWGVVQENQLIVRFATAPPLYSILEFTIDAP